MQQKDPLTHSNKQSSWEFVIILFMQMQNPLDMQEVVEQKDPWPERQGEPSIFLESHCAVNYASNVHSLLNCIFLQVTSVFEVMTTIMTHVGNNASGAHFFLLSLLITYGQPGRRGEWPANCSQAIKMQKTFLWGEFFSRNFPRQTCCHHYTNMIYPVDMNVCTKSIGHICQAYPSFSLAQIIHR